MSSVNGTVNVCSDNSVAVNTGAPMDASGSSKNEPSRAAEPSGDLSSVEGHQRQI